VQRKELNFVFWEQEISVPCNIVVAIGRLEGFYLVIVLILTFQIWAFKSQFSAVAGALFNLTAHCETLFFLSYKNG